MRKRPSGARCCVALAALLAVAVLAPAAAQTTSKFPGGSGLPVPRFVSLKSDRVNMREGPGTDYRTVWVYQRAGLPVEVVKEFEGWRQVRDAYGAVGWVVQSLLSGRRTALVLPWEVKSGTPPPKVALRDNDSGRADAVAMVEAGIIANISSCDGRWCYVTIDKFRGYIEQKKLWGVYEGEVIE